MIAAMRHRFETMTHCGQDTVIHSPCNLITQGESVRFLHTIPYQHMNVIKNTSS